MPAEQPAEKIRLVIWDLDETFWSGTLTEGGATAIPRNVAILRTLSARGIVNAVCSKNDAATAQAELERQGVWDHIVFPRIAWQPKGPMVRDIVEASQLRPETILFVDDNPMNLNEVGHLNPGLQLAGPELLETLLDDPRFHGKDDRALTRLAQYRLLDQKQGERARHGEDAHAFLRQSDVRISFHYDVLEQFDRIHELINRTNQLNFTKLRLPEDPAAARAELERLLTTEHDRHCGYVKVADRYGYYGVVGFYMVKGPAMVHFTFSCRTLNMGIEQFVYDRLKRPWLKVVGEVVSDPFSAAGIDWVRVTDDAEHLAAPVARQAVSICIRGGCELAQSSHYLRQRFTVVEEMPFPKSGWGISPPLTQYATALRDMADPVNRALLESFPGLDAACFDNAAFNHSADVYVLAFTQESFVGTYRYKPTGLVIPLMIGRGTIDLDLTKLTHAEIAEKSNFRCDTDWWAWFCANFERVGGFDPVRFADNLRALFAHLAGKQVVIVQGNTRHGKFVGINRKNAAVNKVVARTVAHLAARVIEVDDLIHDDAEVVQMNHFRREVYMRLAAEIAALIECARPTEQQAA